jgi:TldD protein
MESFALDALDEVVRCGAGYADVRARRERTEHVRTRDGALHSSGEERNSGFGIRVLVDGAWGFAAHEGLDRSTIGRVAAAAVEAARAAAAVSRWHVELALAPSAVDMYVTPLARNPFEVDLDEKSDLALRADEAIRHGASVKVSSAELLSFHTDTQFVSSEGARIRQEIVECGGSVHALAAGDGKPARRTFSNYAQAGWEYVDSLDLMRHAERVGQEASDLLVAPFVDPGPTDVVLGSEQLALMVHETCGHPTELDRVLGFEDAFAGGSFLHPVDLGVLRYGSRHVNLSADSTLPGGLGTFGYDDDGVPAQRFMLVEDGIFSGYLSSRDTAPMIGWERSTGCSRANSWDRTPIVRMVNVSLEPGDIPLDDLIGDIDSGLYLDTPSSWSLDDKRLNFHFGMEYAREIKNGALGALRRGATLQNITPEFWGRCDGIAGPEHWILWGILSCAKGEPLQGLHVGHGAAPARFRNLPIGLEQ